ncbi:hypothetical protein PISMIDRAFT_680512 [Pisolithus microcarpus 441]|uniref:Uncharacterized protein n=1 Tax=Pisolithus microcarpus 441 TaxID=765257 RepID=A0A0C9Z811_9AGAM|nr:hypothetical protein BKA83DRAFT_680512 [Pisolithus microcarpus]KIK22199.1 hypothetical protein PISMIDRAFT_680512 [Pisolithus microcarpus 441]
MAASLRTAAVFSASKAKDIPDCIKPYRNEALIRLRNSSVCLVALVVTTHLLPVPSLWTAANVVRDGEQRDTGFLWGICATELGFLALLILNIVQAAFALKYPRKPHHSHVSPTKSLQVTPKSQSKRQPILSPNASTGPRAPQRTSSLYNSSPLSTPSRTLYYSMPSTPSSFNISLTSSTSSMPPTPSPSLGAYHATHGGSMGQPFDGLTLSALADAQSDEED